MVGFKSQTYFLGLNTGTAKDFKLGARSISKNKK